ncbi:MAG: hypothetical protein Q9228_004092 [Teloschistes exilis]
MIKRKATGGTLEPNSQRKKRVAFTATRNSKTKAVIARNIEQCPLLRLPLELRNKIWRFVLGDQMIHIDYQHNHGLTFEQNEELTKTLLFSSVTFKFVGSAWRHIVCQNDASEDQPDRYVQRPARPRETRCVGPHWDCKTDYLQPDPNLPVDFKDHETMRLTILRACRSIYVETNQILFSTNTFSFDDSIALKHFMMTRTAHQKRLIRSLRININWWSRRDNCAGAWSTTLSMALVRSLSNLRTVRVQLNAVPPGRDFYHDGFTNFETLMTSFHWKYMLVNFGQGLRKLSTLPLTDVQVGVGGFSEEGSPWPAEMRKQMADYWQSKLINPKGAEIYEKEERDRMDEARLRREAREAAKAATEAIWREEARMAKEAQIREMDKKQDEELQSPRRVWIQVMEARNLDRPTQ